MPLTGCVVWEASQAWSAIVCAVSKLPMKRIISGNDHWHCLPWLMATSQYLTSHHSHQSYSRKGNAWSSYCGICLSYILCVVCNYVLWVVKFTATCSDDRPVKWAVLLCVNWTGCWVMCFMKHGQTCQSLLVMPVPSLSFPSSYLSSSFPLSHHNGDALRCAAGTCGLTAHQSQEKLNIVCVCVCPCKRVIP